MGQDRQLEAFKEYVLGQLRGEPGWQVTSSSQLWICPYCGMEGARKHDEPEKMLKEVLGHLFYRCKSFRGGKGMAKTHERLKEYARLHDFHRRVRKDSAFFVVDEDRRWYDPYTGQRTPLKIKGRKPSVGELTRLLAHLDRMSAKRKSQGEDEPEPFSPEEMELSVKLHTDRMFRCYDALNRWYDPFTLEPTSIRLDAETKRVTPRQIRETWEYLSNSMAYRANSGTPPHPYERVRDAVKRGNKRLMLAHRLRTIVRREPAWTVQGDNGFWVCPFCRDEVETVDIRTPFLLREVGPRQMARHLVDQCDSYRSGTEPARTAGELAGTPLLASSSMEVDASAKNSETGARLRSAEYASAAQAFERLQKESGPVDKEWQAILDARPSVEELERQREQQEEQRRVMERARQVQLNMLPKVPALEGFELDVVFNSCDEVSGDFYDFVEVSDNEIGIVVGDVAGHGVHAALVMAAAKQALKILSKGISSPREALIKLNDDLKPNLPSNIFVTIWYAVLNLRTMALTHVRAGHNPLLVYNANHEPKLRKYEPKGMIVGMAPGSIFGNTLAEETIILRKGDLVLQYTDGVTEAMDQEKNEYGEDRLDEFMVANGDKEIDEFLKALDEDIHEFRRGAEPNDDVTFLALRYVGREAEKSPAEQVVGGGDGTGRKEVTELRGAHYTPEAAASDELLAGASSSAERMVPAASPSESDIDFSPHESVDLGAITELKSKAAATKSQQPTEELTTAEPVTDTAEAVPAAAASDEFFAMIDEIDPGVFGGEDPFAPVEPADDEAVSTDYIEPIPEDEDDSAFGELP